MQSRRPAAARSLVLALLVAITVSACGGAIGSPAPSVAPSGPAGSPGSTAPATPGAPATPDPSPASSPIGSPSVPPLAGDTLVHVLLRGGHCRTGECRSEVTISAWGTVQRDDGPAVLVPGPALAALVDAIRATDFDAILARPFTGECPTAYDGQEAVFTIATPEGPVEIASCSVEVNPNAPLFVALDRIVQLAPYPAG
jgi:hypothetical protein